MLEVGLSTHKRHDLGEGERVVDLMGVDGETGSITNYDVTRTSIVGIYEEKGSWGC